MQDTPRVTSLWRRVRSPALTLAVMFVVELLDWGLGSAFEPDSYGICPRHLIGLRGLVFAPLLHDGWTHLVQNAVPFLVTGSLVGPRHFWALTLWVALVGGLAVWITGGSNEIHLGASSLIFGYCGFLVAHAFRQRRPSPILVALLVLCLYGASFTDVLPLTPGVSWEGHLFGFLAGISGVFLTDRRPPHTV